MRSRLAIAGLLLLLSALSALPSPQFFTRHDIHDDFNRARSVYAADVDGDGDVDVLSAAYYNDRICWWENTGGTPLTFVQHYTRHNYDGAHSSNRRARRSVKRWNGSWEQRTYPGLRNGHRTGGQPQHSGSLLAEVGGRCGTTRPLTSGGDSVGDSVHIEDLSAWTQIIHSPYHSPEE